MKMRIRRSLSLIAVSVLMVSCDWFEKLDDVDFDITQTVSFVVNETATNPEGKNYSTSETLDISSAPDVAKYADKIKSYKVNKVTYKIMGVTPAAGVTLNDGKIEAAGAETIASAGAIPLTNTPETELTTNNSGIDELVSSLLASKQAQISLTGHLSKTPVTCTVTVKFYLKVTANALD
jgi:hypothetical protein